MSDKITYVLENPLYDFDDERMLYEFNRSPVIIVENGMITNPSEYDLEGLELLEWLEKYPEKLQYRRNALKGLNSD